MNSLPFILTIVKNEHRRQCTYILKLCLCGYSYSHLCHIFVVAFFFLFKTTIVIIIIIIITTIIIIMGWGKSVGACTEKNITEW